MGALLLVRHGEADGNRDHRFIGQLDVPLSERGRRQAAAVSARLITLGVSRFISSDLARAVETIAPAADQLGLPIETDPRLREIDNGEWRGLYAHEVAARWPDVWARYRAGDDVPRPGGERWADVRRRVVGALRDHAQRLGDGDLVAVGTHGGPTLAAASWAAGLRPRGNLYQVRLSLPWNASITTLGFPGPTLVGFNDVGHLPPELLGDAEMPFLERP